MWIGHANPQRGKGTASLNLVYGLVAKKACTQMKYRTKDMLSTTKRNRLSRTVSKTFIFTESIPTQP